MQKITEIKELHTIKRRQLENGVESYVEKKVVRFHEINYVEGLPRLGHFLLDRVFFYFFALGIGFAIGVVLELLNRQDFLNEPYFNLVDILFSWLILQPAYYFIFEISMQSSPAKLLLGRIVVDEYGNKPTPKQILIRSFSRAVPFEIFSCMAATGWHDDWSKTLVMRKKDLKALRLMQKINNIEEPISPINE